MTIGQRISELRRSFGYSQEYIAEQLQVSRQAVSKWEQDQSAPDTYNLIALAKLLNVTVEYLAVGKKQEISQAASVSAEHTPTVSPSYVPPRKAGQTQRTVGYILLTVGLFGLVVGVPLAWVLSDLIGVAFLRILFFIPAIITLIGILCLICKKYFWLVFLWLSTALVLLIMLVVMPTTSHVIVNVTTGEVAPPQPTGLPIYTILIWLLPLAAIVCTIITVIRSIKCKK